MSKCKFWKMCKWYNEMSYTCNKTGGVYYSGDSPAGCYVRNANAEKKAKVSRSEKKEKENE